MHSQNVKVQVQLMYTGVILVLRLQNAIQASLVQRKSNQEMIKVTKVAIEQIYQKSFLLFELTLARPRVKPSINFQIN